MPVDISPMMDHPGWKTITPAQRKQALDLWQDPATTESERAEMRQVMDSWAASAAQEPSAASRVVSSVGGMLKEVPGLAWNATLGPFARAGGYDPNAQPREGMPSPKEIEQKAELLAGEIGEGAKGALGLMAAPALGKSGYKVGETILSKLAPYVVNRPVAQTVANALPAIGEAGGNYLSRQANVAMGNEQPGIVGDVASAALPLVVRGLTSAPVARRLPGSAVAQHEMVAEDVRAGVARMQPKVPSETLYEQVYKGTNPTINSGNLRQMAEGIIKTEMEHGPSTRSGTLLGLAQDLKALSAQYGDEIPMDRLYREMKRYGEKIGEAGVAQTAGTKGISKLYAGFHEALEDAANSNIPESETLRQAIKASRQEHAVTRLQKIIGQSEGEGRGIDAQDVTGYTFVRGKSMLNQFERALADDDVFRGSFDANDVDEMRKLFESGRDLPKLPLPGSVAKGAGQWAIKTSVGTGLGYALGGPEGAAIGGSLGATAPEVISQLMMSKIGRQYLHAALEGRGGINPQALAVLNQVARELPAGTYTSKRRSATSP